MFVVIKFINGKHLKTTNKNVDIVLNIKTSRTDHFRKILRDHGEGFVLPLQVANEDKIRKDDPHLITDSFFFVSGLDTKSAGKLIKSAYRRALISTMLSNLAQQLYFETAGNLLPAWFQTRAIISNYYKQIFISAFARTSLIHFNFVTGHFFSFNH